MRDRCENPESKDYKRYGAKGITVCARWSSFENFLADMGKRPAGRTIDRLDGLMGYEPGNCRWATPVEQTMNSCVPKLNRDAVRAIRRDGRSYPSIAKAYSVSVATVCLVKGGKAWKHVGDVGEVQEP